MSNHLLLNFAGIRINIYTDPATENLLLKNFSGLLGKIQAPNNELNYTTSFWPDLGIYRIDSPTGDLIEVDNDSDFIYFMEKTLTIDSQTQRPDLFFLHSAALKFENRTALFMGKSGAGKSTTTYALTRHGFRYLSDELSPINLHDMNVMPYAHALCLKAVPPEPYLLPETTLKTSRTMHVPVESLAGGVESETSKVTDIFFIEYNAQQDGVMLERVKPGSATVQLYTNGLNHLCHEDAGLPAASRIVQACDCYSLVFNDVSRACNEIKTLLQQA